MPRPEEDGQGPISPHQTYGSLFETRAREAGWRVTVDAERARTIVDVRNSLAMSHRYRVPIDVLIVQVGVVDCAPRVLTAGERRLLEKIRPRRVQRAIVSWLHERRPFLVRKRRHVYVPLPVFEDTFAQVARASATLADRRVGVVAIAPTLADAAHRSPGFAENIRLYNECLKAVCERELVSFIDPFAGQPAGALPKLIRSDGHHLTVAGNALYADVLTSWLSGIAG